MSKRHKSNNSIPLSLLPTTFKSFTILPGKDSFGSGFEIYSINPDTLDKDNELYIQDNFEATYDHSAFENALIELKNQLEVDKLELQSLNDINTDDYYVHLDEDYYKDIFVTRVDYPDYSVIAMIYRNEAYNKFREYLSIINPVGYQTKEDIDTISSFTLIE